MYYTYRQLAFSCGAIIFDHALSSVTMIQLHHAWGSLAIKPEEMASNLYNTLYSLSER
jgi:hypothetical protein